MPKHDEPISMAEHDAREKAALLARLTTKDEAEAKRKATIRKITKEAIGRGAKFKCVDFKLSRADRQAIVATMPQNVSARDKVAWKRQIERALDAHCQDLRLLDGERHDLRDRLGQLHVAATKLQEFFEQPAVAAKKSPELGEREKIIHREIWNFLRRTYAEDGGDRDLQGRTRYWRETVEDNFYEGLGALAHASDIALQVLKRGKGDADNESERQLIAAIAKLWLTFTNRRPAFSNGTDQPTGPFPRHVKAIVATLPQNFQPKSVSGFIKRAKKTVLSAPKDGDHKS